MKRYLVLSLLCVAVAAMFAMRASDDREPTATEQVLRSQFEENQRAVETPLSDKQVDVVEPEAPAEEGSVKLLPRNLAQRTSWTNPYAESVWESANWQFNEDSMTALSVSEPAAQTPCKAEFLREWKTFTVDMRIGMGANDANLTEAGLPLILEVVHAISRDAVRISLQRGQVTVEGMQSGQAIPLREATLPEDDGIGELRVSLTPNRLLVWSGRSLLLNVTRPSFLTGERCRFRILAPGGATIRDLRFDGE